MCQEGWKALSDEEKKPYVEKHEEDIKRSKEVTEEEAKKATKKPRALTAYQLFSANHREEMKKANPGMIEMNELRIDLSPVKMMKKLGEAWKNASEEEKKMFEEEAAKEKEEVAKQIKEMEQSGVVFSGKNEKKNTAVTEETVFNSAEWLFIEEKMEDYRKDHTGWIYEKL